LPIKTGPSAAPYEKVVDGRFFQKTRRSHEKLSARGIWVQGQGGRKYQTGDASEASALRGKYTRYFEELI